MGATVNVARAGYHAIRPAVPFLVKAGAVTGALLVGGEAAHRLVGAYGDAKNPPLQKEGLDTDPTVPGEETWIAFDRRTGRTLVFGEAPSDKVGPERSQEREITTGIWIVGLLLGGALLLNHFGRGR